MKIEKVILTLENCEEIELQKESIVNIFVGGITRNIYTTSEYFSADCFFLQLAQTANLDVHTFGIESESENTFKRLEYGDICNVDIQYEDRPNETFTVKYNEEGDYLGAPNTYQCTTYDNDGNLCILISDSKNFSDFGINENS